MNATGEGGTNNESEKGNEEVEEVNSNPEHVRSVQAQQPSLRGPPCL